MIHRDAMFTEMLRAAQKYEVASPFNAEVPSKSLGTSLEYLCVSR